MKLIHRLFFPFLVSMALTAHAQTNPFEQAVQETFTGRFVGKDAAGQDIVLRLKPVGEVWGGSLLYKGVTYDLVAEQKPGQVVGTFGPEKFPFSATVTDEVLKFTAGSFSTALQRQKLPKLEGVFASKRVKLDFQNQQGDHDGEITYNGKTFPFTAKEEAGELVGIFKQGEQVFPFSLTVEPHAMLFKTGAFVEELELPARRDARLAKEAAERAEKQRREEAARLAEETRRKQEEEARLAEEQRQEQARNAQRALASATQEQPWTNTLGMQFVPVPGTEVLFCVWETRVQDYRAYANANSGVDRNWQNPGFTQGDTHPVCGVSWEDARAFCAWLTKTERQTGRISSGQSYRLPADWEWSVAVGLRESRGGTPTDKDEKTPGEYPWGRSWPPPRGAGNYDSTLKVDEYVRTSPVGSFQANRYGLYDLGGNLWEWCEDWYDGEQKYRVLRGASWGYSGVVSLLSSRRNCTAPGDRGCFIGFRVVLVVGASDQPVKLQEKAASPAAGSAQEATQAGGESKQPTARRDSPFTAMQARPWTNSLGMKFVPVTGTKVLFCIWETRVKDYAAFVEAAKAEWTKPTFEQGPTHPAVNVTWRDAKQFCRWLTEKEHREGKLEQDIAYRLPLDFEWSRAVGLADEASDLLNNTAEGMEAEGFGQWPWGSDWPPQAVVGNYGDLTLERKRSGKRIVPGYNDQYAETSPVGSFQPSQLGLHDLSGNVWEWCEEDYTMRNGALLEDHPRILRGGAWTSGSKLDLLSARRRPGTAPSEDTGFRVVLSPRTAFPPAKSP